MAGLVVDSMTTRDKSTVKEEYFDWLCAHITPEYGALSNKAYYGLFKCLHEKQFVWVVANDDNRIQDGLDLRNCFLHDIGYEGSDPFVDSISHKGMVEEPVSVMEVLIGLSRRLAFLDEETPEIWAWRLIENLGLHKMCDPIGPEMIQAIDEKLETLIWRTYDPDGTGGFFPLSYPGANQTKVEIWYQMAAYLEENQIE